MTVDISGQRPATVDVKALQEFVAATLDREGVPSDAELSISFIGNDEIATLNEEHLGKAGPTDVLSFPIEDAAPGVPPQARNGGPPLALGDIFISTDIVSAHAAEYDVSFDDELHLMVCHGVLHILGWDHVGDEDAEKMEAREAHHLATIGKERR
ncbi:MAG: rRNA maturation RNase YbeY [Acidimicrobiia bacterium]